MEVKRTLIEDIFAVPCNDVGIRLWKALIDFDLELLVKEYYPLSK